MHMGEGEQTGEIPGKVRMVRFADGGDPVTVNVPGKENVWAIGRPDERRTTWAAENLRTTQEVAPGTLFKTADGSVMEVTTPSRAATSTLGPEGVKDSVFVRRVLPQEAETLVGQGKTVKAWEDVKGGKKA